MNKIERYNPFFDFVIIFISLYFSSHLIPGVSLNFFFIFLFPVFKILVFYLGGVYKSLIQFWGIYELKIFLLLNFIGSLSLFLFSVKHKFILFSSEFLTTSTLILLLRIFEKYLINLKIKSSNKSSKKEKRLNALIVGAGEAGYMVLREIKKHPESNINVLGFIDDSLEKKGKRIGGKKIFGDRYKIPDIVKEKNVNLIILAIPSVSFSERKKILKICEKLDVQLKIVPSTYEIIKGDVKFEQIRDIKIEDLLGREEVKIDTKSIQKYIKGKKVLITGAGGSIGSELARQVSSFSPNKLLLLGKGENSIFNINMELQEKYRNLKLEPIIADIRDYDKLESVFKRYCPEIVFHAAAHKHVYLMELHPDEAFKNNVVGTLNLAKLSVKYGVKKFVLISTDKSVKPKSVMGITKNISEKIVVGLNQKYNKKTKFVAVRFGNVLGSRGSVVPIFQKQIEKGGPVTVTHPEVKRYFMTIPEAVQLVLQAGSLGNGGEVFILDMGKPIKIVDLAKKMIALSGYKPDKDIKIKFIGLKPGEKIFEELILDKKNVYPTKHREIFLEKSYRINIDKLEREIKILHKNLSSLSKNEIKKRLKSLIR